MEMAKHKEDDHIDKKQKTENQQDEAAKARRPRSMKLARKNKLKLEKILCRQTCLDDEIYNQLVEKAKEEGYDVSKLHKPTQSYSPPESEDGPKDTKGIWWIKSILGK